MRKKLTFLIISIIFFSLGFVGVSVYRLKNMQTEDAGATTLSYGQDERSKLSKPTMTVGNSIVYVDVADNDTERAQGLSGRERLADNEGMLFLYQFENYPTFWMKDMNFNLDFIWINDGKVVDITKNVPKPESGATFNDLPRYSPSVPVDAVLEVNAGFVNEKGIEIGDEVVLPDNH